MKYNYKTISQVEKITNENDVKILNYIERVSKTITREQIGRTNIKYLFRVNEKIDLVFLLSGNISIRKNDYFIGDLNGKIFADNITGLFGSIKNYG